MPAGGLALMAVETADDGDDALIARVAMGDEAAYGRLVRRHAAAAHALAARTLGIAADAEEVVQEAFWRVWRVSAGWRAGEARFSTWLHRVVVNLAIDRIRRERIRRWLPFAEGFDPPDPGPGTNAAHGARAELAVVMADLRRLPARQRVALMLAAGGEHSNGEIARLMDTSESAVETLLVRARRTLRARRDAREGGGS